MTAHVEPASAADEPEGRTIRLRWDPGADVNTTYANQLFLSHAGNQFYLVFGEARVPAYFREDDAPEEVPVSVVARIAVTPDAMLEFRRAIDANVDRYLTRQAEAQDE